MTRQGYTHIIVPKTLHEKLKLLAQVNGTSIAKLIEKLVDAGGINTGINTGTLKQALNSQNHSFNWQNGSESSLKREKGGFGTVGSEIWCSGRDLNPGPRLERPLYLTGLYYRSLGLYYWNNYFLLRYIATSPFSL